MKISMKQTAVAISSVLLTGAVGTVAAHGLEDIGAPACLEANFMMADAMNNNPAGFGPAGAPWAAANGPGQVLEVSIVTGARGITVTNPFAYLGPSDGSDPICGGDGVNNNPDISCAGDGDGKAPFKPTGVLSGGLNGHAFITSAGQQALTEFHRDGTPIRSVSYRPTLGNPSGNAGLGSLPRPLGTQMMPNGNIAQAICDANFFNANNSDRDPGYHDPQQIKDGDPQGTNGGGNTSWKYFPPVYSTPARAANSRVLVLDQESLEVVDEYSQPADQDARWTCMAGIAFSEEGMGLSMFHGAAIAMVDWKAGLTEGRSTGVGSNSVCNKNGKGCFEIDDDENKSVVSRWIDMRPGEPADDPSRRDSLRAWGYDEDGTIYATDRERSADCLEGHTPGTWSGSTAPPACHPGVFRQKVQVVDWGSNSPDRTIGLDPGVNVIAGIRPNRMSAVACSNIGGTGADCDVETLLVAASAFNPGCSVTGGTPPAPCFVPGGGVGEYSIDPDDADGASASCTGAQGGAQSSYGPGGANEGCAQPIAKFLGRSPDVGTGPDLVDPRMLMVIHEAFVQ
ncbi:MAG: hypothetical protein OEU91_10465 [Gammaproteobacteria bacterium]|nr:hypothetical protein [Gammaproteobacteria bacterium]